MVRLNGLLKSEQPLLVVFYASWCPHCKKMLPIVDHLEKSEKGRLGVERYDIDAPENEKLLNYYNVRSVPTFILFRAGDQVWRQSGEMPGEQLAELVRKYEQK